MKLTTLRPSDFGPRFFGPKCPAHKERHMKRTGPLEYACIESGQVFSLKECLASAQDHPIPADTPPVPSRAPDAAREI